MKLLCKTQVDHNDSKVVPAAGYLSRLNNLRNGNIVGIRKIEALVIFKLFINGEEKCHSIDVP